MEDTFESVISFEGPEKVLEVWFIDPAEYEDDNGVSLLTDETEEAKSATPVTPKNSRYLLDVSRDEWKEMLDLVNCEILSEISTVTDENLPNQARAFLLSESSLFVYSTQIIIKTCGTTTLLNCLHKLLAIAHKVGLTKVDNVFYNRQNFFFPERQLAVHRDFKSECRVLDSFFRNGNAMIVGRINDGANHYNMYNAESRMSRSDPAMLEKDSTLEILMTGLDRDAMKNFYFEEGVTNKQIRDKTGITDFFPNAIIDDYMFQPFGYSLNALMDDGYYTIHITPQDHCSFVSFETNVYMEDYTELINKVLNCFQPERFILVHLANSLVVKDIKANNNERGFDANAIVEKKFKIVDDIYCRFDHYNMYFLQMNRLTNSDSIINKKRRQDEEGTILKSDSPFVIGLKGGDIPGPVFTLDEGEEKTTDEPVCKKAKLC